MSVYIPVRQGPDHYFGEEEADDEYLRECRIAACDPVALAELRIRERHRKEAEILKRRGLNGSNAVQPSASIPSPRESESAHAQSERSEA